MNRITSFFSLIGRSISSALRYGGRHKVQAGVVLVVLAGLSYWGYTTYAKSVTTTQYVLAVAHTALIEETVTGSGQIASEHQLNLAPKASGTLTSVSVRAGQSVVAGQVIATVDNSDAQKGLRDATASLESARISYQQSLTSTSNTVEKAQTAVFTTGATVFGDMNTVLTGLEDIMRGDEVTGSTAVSNIYAYAKFFNNAPELVTLRDRAIASHEEAKRAYDSAFTAYNRTSRTSSPQTVADLANTTYEAADEVAQAAKDLNDYLRAVDNRFVRGATTKPSVLATHLSSSLSYVNSMNSDVNSTLSVKNDLDSAIQSGNGGASTLSQASAELTYQKAKNSYQDAQENLADYVVRAPFAGVIAQVPLQKFDQTGSGTTVAVLVTKQQIASLSLNEVDAAKVRAGQKANLTFDAFDGLSVTGTVAEVDTVGTVSQGVVTYTVKIGFDSHEETILPGMTVNATIITASKADALVIPSSAIKTQGTETYVEVATMTGGPVAGERASTTPRRQLQENASSTGSARTGGDGGPTVDAQNVTTRRVSVTTGLSSETMTEITSGLTQGEFVVSQSLNATGKSTTQAPSLLNLFGGGRAGSTRGTGSAATRATGGAPAGGFTPPSR